MNSSQLIDGRSLTTEALARMARDPAKRVRVGPLVEDGVRESRTVLDELVEANTIIYGVNTSIGGFVDWLVPKEHAQELQNNLLAAVATNVGELLPDAVVRGTMLARINSLARGASAISLENFQKYVALYNSGVIPCVPARGSLGASGDLGPLAYIGLVATGRWRARCDGEIVSGADALQRRGIEPMQLGYKEGLALINGTSAMAAYGALVAEDAALLVRWYDAITALSIETLRGKSRPFAEIVHRQKPHRGQLQTAANITRLLAGSELAMDEQAVSHYLAARMDGSVRQEEIAIEDSYSLRCTPQIVGPVRDTLHFVLQIVTDELNSSNDNPLVLAETREAYHNGHFHGQYIATAMDFLSIALTTITNLADRRADRFLDVHHSNGLPAFLCPEDPGRRIGLMGGQLMATSLTAENRSLCTPASIQTLPATAGFQDLVSMGLIAARRAADILKNARYVVAFELLCACQAADIRGVRRLSPAGRRLHAAVRARVPYLASDVPLTDILESLANLLGCDDSLAEVTAELGGVPL